MFGALEGLKLCRGLGKRASVINKGTSVDILSRLFVPNFLLKAVLRLLFNLFL